MKIYYSVEPKRNGFQVTFLDMRGQLLLWENPFPTMPNAIKAYKDLQPGAVFLEWNAFCKRIERIEDDRRKVLEWNAGQPKKYEVAANDR